MSPGLVSSAKHLVPSSRFCLSINMHAHDRSHPRQVFKMRIALTVRLEGVFTPVFLTPWINNSSSRQPLLMDFAWFPTFGSCVKQRITHTCDPYMHT